MDILPTIIGLLTAQMIDMEFEAGRFQVLLAGTKRRSQSYLGKLSVLLLGGFCSNHNCRLEYLHCYLETKPWPMELQKIFSSL